MDNDNFDIDDENFDLDDVDYMLSDEWNTDINKIDSMGVFKSKLNQVKSLYPDFYVNIENSLSSDDWIKLNNLYN